MRAPEDDRPDPGPCDNARFQARAPRLIAAFEALVRRVDGTLGPLAYAHGIPDQDGVIAEAKAALAAVKGGIPNA